MSENFSLWTSFYRSSRAFRIEWHLILIDSMITEDRPGKVFATRRSCFTAAIFPL